jgi:hypothetical protein
MNESQGKRFFIVDEDQLRAKILELAPGIRHDADVMADLIRESVKFEREKLGLDNPRGTIGLYPNKDKKLDSDPDFTGSASVAGRLYRAFAWISKEKIRIALLPRNAK